MDAFIYVLHYIFGPWATFDQYFLSPVRLSVITLRTASIRHSAAQDIIDGLVQRAPLVHLIHLLGIQGSH